MAPPTIGVPGPPSRRGLVRCASPLWEGTGAALAASVCPLTLMRKEGGPGAVGAIGAGLFSRERRARDRGRRNSGGGARACARRGDRKENESGDLSGPLLGVERWEETGQRVGPREGWARPSG